MFDEEERKIYDVRMHTLIEVKSKIASAEEQGMEKGMAQEKLNIAINLLDVLDVEIIALKTGLPDEEIKKLKHSKYAD